MTLDNIIKRAAISATVGISLKSIHNDPKRAIRNAFDFFERFTNEIFDENTLNKIRHETENPTSAFCKLILKLAKNVDNSLLKLVATNLAFNRLIIFPSSISMFNTKNVINRSYPIITTSTIEALVEQGESVGAYFYVITGEEPLKYKKEVLEVCKKHPNCVFYIRTSGKLIDDKLADNILDIGNIILAITMDNGEMSQQQYNCKSDVFKLLHKKHCLFGFSVKDSSSKILCCNTFIDNMISQGCTFGWFDCGNKVYEVSEGITKLTKNSLISDNNPIFLADPISDKHYLSHFSIGGRGYITINSDVSATYQISQNKDSII